MKRLKTVQANCLLQLSLGFSPIFIRFLCFYMVKKIPAKRNKNITTLCTCTVCFPVYLFFLDHLVCFLTAGVLYTGCHAVDICVRAEPDGMAFTTSCCFSLRHEHPPLPFLTHQVLFIFVHIWMCFCVLWSYGADVLKTCPVQSQSLLGTMCSKSPTLWDWE